MAMKLKVGETGKKNQKNEEGSERCSAKQSIGGWERGDPSGTNTQKRIQD